MTKRITALFFALLLAVLCLPLPAASAAGEVTLKTSVEYTIVPCHAENMAADLKAENRKDLQICKANSSENQTWYLGKVGDYYTISCKIFETVVEVPNGNAVGDQMLELSAYDGSDKQLWRLELMDDGSYSIHSKLNDSLCWDVQGEKTENGTRIMLHSQHKNKNQRFRFNLKSAAESAGTAAAQKTDELDSNDTGTTYTIVPLHAETAALDIKAENRRDIQICKSNNSENQTWLFCKVGNYYTISSRETEGVVEAPDGKAVLGQRLQVNWYDGSDKQLWRLEKTGDGSYFVHSKLDDSLVWDAEGSETKNLTRIMLYPKHGKKNQLFRFNIKSKAESGGSGQGTVDSSFNIVKNGFEIRPCHAENSALDIKAENRTDIQLYQSNRSMNQEWMLCRVGDYFTISSRETEGVVEVPVGRAIIGQKLQVNWYDGTDKQLWRLEKTADGSYLIHSKLDDALVWDIEGAQTKNLTRLMLYPQTGKKNQLFRFSVVSPAMMRMFELDETARDSTADYTISPRSVNTSSIDLMEEDLTGIQIYTTKSVDNQYWGFKKVGIYYVITSRRTGGVIEVSNGNAVLGQALQVGEYDGSDKQLWELELMDDGSYIIHSKLNLLLVWSVQGKQTANHTRIALYPQDDSENQRFEFVFVPGTGEEAASGGYELDDFARYGVNEEYVLAPACMGGHCVAMLGDDSILCYKSQRYPYNRWKLKRVGSYYAFVNVKHNKAMDVPGANAFSGQTPQGYNYNGSDAQLWRLQSMGDGTYTIHSKINDNLVLDLDISNSRFTLYTQHNGKNQRFRFLHTSTIEPMSDWGASRQDCSGSNWSVWDGSVNDFGFYDNHKNETDLYITKASELGGLITLVNNGWSMESKTIHLMCDIDLAGIHWTPIGFSGHYFKGSFNGHNHAIIGLKNMNKDDNVGLFGMVDGGTICNLAVKGTIQGDERVGGIVGYLASGHVCNVYSEVKIANATDDYEGGIVGYVESGGLVDHCTQNAVVNSDDADDYRGGIAGFSRGCIRYCVNNTTVNQNNDYGGGIAGTFEYGLVEYCANHGTVGGGDSKYIGGIVGEMSDNGVIFGCYNDGEVCSTNDDYIGGICGKANSDWMVICCVNNGRVYGDDQIGGICGEGRPIKCLNMGVVTGHEEVGAIAGNAKSDTPYCYALAWSSASLAGKEGSRSEWVSTEDILSGKVCHDMNWDPVTSTDYGITDPMTQNIGSDPYPTFGSAPVNNSLMNNEYRVTVDCQRGYGRVKGAGTYSSGAAVTLTAKPAAGCVFDYYEVVSAASGGMTGWNGERYACPTVTTRTYHDAELKLTDSIRQCYTVKAVFKVFDDTPDDMKVTVKLELECTNDAGGWNSKIFPVDLVDSAGDLHHWETDRTMIDDVGEKVSHTFDLGTTSPVAVYAYPDFGGGLSPRSLGLVARMWINGSGRALESKEVVINSGLFVTSKHGGDYMSISFENYGNSTVGGASFSTCTDAWERAKSDSSRTLRLESAWLIDSPLVIGGGQTVNLDLNGYPIIRTIKKTDDDGELILISEDATLNITDSTPSRKSCGSFTGGSIQGGRSDDTAGLIECRGTLNMNGGTLYNGGTTDKGGAIKLTGSARANLNGVLISDCWTDKATFYQNEGGAIYMKDKAQANLKNCTIRYCRAYDYGGGVYLEDDNNRLNCGNVSMIACTANDNQGGGVYQDHGETNWVGGKISNCRASEDHGGAVYQNNGKAYFEKVDFDGNYAEDNGGAIYSDANEGLWLIGCNMTGNKADDVGGALYRDKKKLYMEDCSVVSNAAVKEGGGVYINSSGDISIAGVIVIRGNDGAGSMDNLVIEDGALLYDYGLEPGSEVHLRSDSNGSVKLGGNLMSEYQLNNYFIANYGRLELVDTQVIDTDLRASVFSGGFTALIIGAVILIAAAVIGMIYKKRQKGETIK